MGYSFNTICWYFIVYSLIGWCVEVVYCTVNSGKIENRGFLDGPVCPIYGFGMLLILFIIKAAGFAEVSDCPTSLLFFGGMFLATLVEFIGGVALMKLFHMRWWNYSNRPFNIGGYICAKYSIFWGIGSLLAIKLVHIPLTGIIESRLFLGHYMLWVLVILSLIYIIDVLGTVRNIIGINKSIERFDKINDDLHRISERLSRDIGQKALAVDSVLDKDREHLEKKAKEFESELQEILNGLSGSKYMGKHRIIHIQHQTDHKSIRRMLEWKRK